MHDEMIKRGKRPERYTVLPNNVLEDDRLDWRDLGLLSYLLSKPDDWEVMPLQLANQRQAGRDAVYNSLKRLREAGYVSRTTRPDGGWEWVVYDSPAINPNTEIPDSAHPKPDKPYTENPNPDIPNPEKPTLLNTETIPNTELQPNTEAALDSDVFITMTLNDKTEHRVTETDVRQYAELYPAVDIRQQLRNMRGWLDDNPTKRKTKSGIRRFIGSWLKREQDRGGQIATQQKPRGGKIARAVAAIEQRRLADESAGSY